MFVDKLFAKFTPPFMKVIKGGVFIMIEIPKFLTQEYAVKQRMIKKIVCSIITIAIIIGVCCLIVNIIT